ncbi:ATP-binding protein [Methylobacterium sp. Leaf89]|uniref:ATP-binding protein n=1 Tax=Methylobacterium sp. Leaf89 TaxID=1736245 RepID=UPI0006F59772|nr:ATP-binding protein [Methylobacterium sp. Leaf89]KQO66883.1 PAS domain-containing sensor histidine kinase [Methylobacterium sp. Leaf89]
MASPRTDDHPAESAPEAGLARLLTASAVPAALLAPDAPGGRILLANRALRDLVRRPADAPSDGDLRDWLGLAGDRDSGATFAAALSGGAPEGVEVLARLGGGAAFWVQVYLVPVPETPYRLAQVVDVTRRHDAEGALALSRQREALGLLTNSVAHEFNNFLQILIGYIDGLKRRLGDRDEPFIQRAIVRSTDAAERATTLTRQLLAFSRRIAPDVRPVDLNGLIEAFGARTGPTLPARITLETRTTPGLACGLSNPTQIELALNHIVANACEAMPAPGRIVIATFAVPPGDRALQRPGDGAVGITVTDEGQGMSPEMAARALAPFVTSREAGRGAGLAIVHGLVKRQNGTVSIDSKPGEGATVRMVFPSAL